MQISVQKALLCAPGHRQLQADHSKCFWVLSEELPKRIEHFSRRAGPHAAWLSHKRSGPLKCLSPLFDAASIGRTCLERDQKLLFVRPSMQRTNYTEYFVVIHHFRCFCDSTAPAARAPLFCNLSHAICTQRIKLSNAR